MPMKKWALVLLILFYSTSGLPEKGPNEGGDLPSLDDTISGKNAASGGGDDLKDLEKALESSEPIFNGQQAQSRAQQPADDIKSMEESLGGLTQNSQPLLEDIPSDHVEVKKPSSRGTASKSSSDRNQITNLEFKMEGNNSRIVVSSTRPIAFQEVRNNGSKQVVYLFENTEVPERLQRAYDTSEFPSSVALFTLLQVSKKQNTSKLIVQLREDTPPTVTPNARGLFIEFPPPKSIPTTQGGLAEGKLLSGSENIYQGGKNYSGQVIKKLEIKNTDVQDVLRLIAKTSGYNIVVGDDVTGKVGTLSLENIPWDQAFTLVLQSKKLGYVREGNVLRVATTTTLKAEKDEALAIEQAQAKAEPLKTVLFPVSYAKAADLAQKVKGFLSERGNVDSDPRSNTVIIKDIEKAITRAQKLLASLDIQPPRVSISAKIVEVSSTWSRTMGFSKLRFYPMNPTPTAYATLRDTSGAVDVGVAPNNGFTAGFRIDALSNFDAQLDLAQTDGKARTLANPSVSVVANQTATITQSLTRFVFDNTTTAGNVVTSLRPVTANLSLAVTPIVSGDGTIFLTVKVTNEIPKGVGSAITIDTRSIDTQVLMENGDTAVIGSVFKNDVNKDRTGVPILMDIPILGFFVSSTTNTDSRNEVFVFVTAKITNAEESFKRNM